MEHTQTTAQGGTRPPIDHVSWEEFAALPDTDRRELIDGELVEIELPTRLHEYVVATLIIILGGWVRQRKSGYLTASGYKVRVSDERGVMPDLQFYKAGNPGKQTPQGLVEGAPDLAVEVISESSERYDRVTKLNWYASIGCPEYWIVDPEARTLQRLVLKEGRYMIMASLADDAIFAPDSFPGLEIPLVELWTIPGGQ